MFDYYSPSHFHNVDIRVLQYDDIWRELVESRIDDNSPDAPAPHLPNLPAPGATDVDNPYDFVYSTIPCFEGGPCDYSLMPFTRYKLPNNAWAVPFVTGHKYKVHWRMGLDWNRIRLTMSERW